MDPEWFTMETAGTMVVAGKANVSLQHLPSGDGAEKSRSEISKKSTEQPVCSGMQVAAAVATGELICFYSPSGRQVFTHLVVVKFLLT